MEPEGIGLLGEDLGDVLPDALVDLRLARAPSGLELDGHRDLVMTVPVEGEVCKGSLSLEAAAALREAVGEPRWHLGGKGPRLWVFLGEQGADEGETRFLLADPSARGPTEGTSRAATTRRPLPEQSGSCPKELRRCAGRAPPAIAGWLRLPRQDRRAFPSRIPLVSPRPDSGVSVRRIRE